MTQKHSRRSSSHPWIDAVWQTVCLTDGTYRATPDGSWDLIFRVTPDKPSVVFLTGQGKEPVDVPYTAGEHGIVISFAAHVYVTQDKPTTAHAGLRFLPINEDGFVLKGVELPLPTFLNAEHLTDKMVEANLLQSDDLVAKAFTANPKAASKRAAQERFKKVTGITQQDFQLIRRAQEAVRRLKSGDKPATVAVDLGYTDQPHMTKSIKKIMGSLPSNLEAVHKI
jgi:AraC-like DNA-binding protein